MTNPRESRTGAVEPRERPVVMVVDDEEPIRALAAEMLGYLGLGVESVPSGEEAVARFRGGARPDLVILDVIMPGMSGIETFRSIRELVPAQKVLIATGFADRSVMDALAAEGASGFIQKPYHLEALAGRVRALLP